MMESERAKLIAEIKEADISLVRDAFTVEREVMRALPEDFVFRYEILWLRVFGAAGGAVNGSTDDNMVSGTRRVTRVSTGQTETRGAAKSGGRAQGVSNKTIIANEHYMRMKQRVDRKLRALAREMRQMLGDGDARAGVRRCIRCRKWAEDTWSFCPWDGQPTEEVN